MTVCASAVARNIKCTSCGCTHDLFFNVYQSEDSTEHFHAFSQSNHPSEKYIYITRRDAKHDMGIDLLESEGEHEGPLFQLELTIHDERLGGV